MTITEDMVQDCINNPGRSRHHEWRDGEQAQYDSLHWRGRTLYDNLRTKYDVDHVHAYLLAVDRFGENEQP